MQIWMTGLWDTMALCAFFVLTAEYYNVLSVPTSFRVFSLIPFCTFKPQERPFSKVFWGLCSVTRGRTHETKVKAQAKCKFFLGSAPTDFLSFRSTMNFNMILIATQCLTFDLQSLASIDHIHQVTEESPQQVPKRFIKHQIVLVWTLSFPTLLSETSPWLWFSVFSISSWLLLTSKTSKNIVISSNWWL